MKSRAWMTVALALALLALPLGAKEKLRYMEKLDRGLVAVQQSDGKVFLSWRLLAERSRKASRSTCIARRSACGRRLTRPIRRTRANRRPFELNAEPLKEGTWLLDASARLDRETHYYVAAVMDGVEQPRSAPYRFAAGAPALPYHSIPLQTPAGYTPNDASVGDLDGDGAVRDRAAPDRRGARQLAAGRDRCADPAGLQARRHAALDDQPRAQHPRRRALHAIPGLRLRRRRPRRGRLQDRRRHDRRHGQSHRRRERQLADARIRGRDAGLGHRAAARGHEPRRFHSEGPEYLTVFDGLTGKALATRPIYRAAIRTPTIPTPSR